MPKTVHPATPVIPRLIRRLILCWLYAVAIETLLLPAGLRDLSGLEGLARMSFPRVLFLTCFPLLLLETATLLYRTRLAASAQSAQLTASRVQTVERWLIPVFFTVDAALVLRASFTWAFLAACVLILLGMILYALFGWRGDIPMPAAPKEKRRAALWLTVGLSLAFVAFVSIWTVDRVRSFSTPTYDFGLFAQMFHFLHKTGLPMTTLERDGLLSHFRVHVSPIYYLMLPFYLLVPRPETLQILQAVVLASSVIPLWLLGRHHGLSAPMRLLLCLLLLLYPSLSGGTSYDLHENCFLTPLILWLLYAIDRKRPLLSALFALLTLCVKEDAAVYVAVIALYFLVRTLLRQQTDRRRQLLFGAGLLVGALAWFFAVTTYLARVGDGVMTYRYSNFMYDGGGSLMTVIKATLLQPLKAVYECVDPEKLRFLALSLLPLLGLPLWTRRFERLILLIPFLLVNLMSDYTYQHDIFFQYTFGSTACLFYLTAVNLADWRQPRKQPVALALAVAVCAVCFGLTVVPKAATYFERCNSNAAYYQQLEEELSVIPADASVTATTFYTTRLSARTLLYDVKYATFEHLLETDYIVLSPSASGTYDRYATVGNEDGMAQLILLLEQNGYLRISPEDANLLIYHRASQS